MDKPTNVRTSVENENLIVDMGRHLAYAALQKPVTAVAQLCGGDQAVAATKFLDQPVDAPFRSARWHAEQIAANIGGLVPFAASLSLVRGGAKFGAEKRFFESFEGSASSLAYNYRTAEMAAAGAVSGAVFEPSESGHVLADRLKHATVGGVTMGVMHRLSNELSSITGASNFSSGILNKSFTAGLAGAGGGAAGVLTEVAVNGGRVPDAESVYKSVYAAAWAGAGLSALAGTSSKLHQPKSSMPQLENYVVKASYKNNSEPMEIAAELMIRDSLLGKTQFATKTAFSSLAKTINKNDANPDSNAQTFSYSRLGPAERVEMIALLENKSSSRLINGESLEALCNAVKKETSSWNADKFKLAEAEVVESRRVLEEARGALERMQDERRDEHWKLFGDVGLFDKVSEKFEFKRIHDVVEKQATNRVKDALQSLRGAESHKDRLYSERAEVLTEVVNKFLDAQNLPPVKVEAASTLNGSASYGSGTLRIEPTLLEHNVFNARQVELLAHELVHHEQDFKRVRLLADRLEIKKVSDESVAKLRDKLADVDMQTYKLEEFERASVKEEYGRIRDILVARNGKPLTPREVGEAGAYLRAYQNYEFPQSENQKALSRAILSVENIHNRSPYSLLRTIRDNPEEFKRAYAISTIPESLRSLAASTTYDTNTRNYSATAQKVAESKSDHLTEQIAVALEPHRKQLYENMRVYEKRQNYHYLQNGMERPAWAAGALAGVMADLKMRELTKDASK